MTMRLYFFRSNEHLCVEQRTLQNALHLAQLFGSQDASLITSMNFLSSSDSRLIGTLCDDLEANCEIASVHAQALALAVERALQANPGAMSAIAFALKHCLLFRGFKEFLEMSYIPLDAPENDVYCDSMEPNEHHQEFEKLVDFMHDLTRPTTTWTLPHNGLILALRQLMLLEERAKLRQFVAFCRRGGFSIDHSLPHAELVYANASAQPDFTF